MASEPTNVNGMTFDEWYNAAKAAGCQYSRNSLTGGAWRQGFDPTEMGPNTLITRFFDAVYVGTRGHKNGGVSYSTPCGSLDLFPGRLAGWVAQLPDAGGTTSQAIQGVGEGPHEAVVNLEQMCRLVFGVLSHVVPVYVVTSSIAHDQIRTFEAWSAHEQSAKAMCTQLAKDQNGLDEVEVHLRPGNKFADGHLEPVHVETAE